MCKLRHSNVTLGCLFRVLSCEFFEGKRDCSLRDTLQRSVINNCSKFQHLLLTGRLWHDDEQLTLPGSNHFLIRLKHWCGFYNARDLCSCSCPPVIYWVLVIKPYAWLGWYLTKRSRQSHCFQFTGYSDHKITPYTKKLFVSIAFQIFKSRNNLQSFISCKIVWFDVQIFSCLIAQAKI